MVTNFLPTRTRSYDKEKIKPKLYNILFNLFFLFAYRGGGGSVQETQSPYKRPRTQSPGSSGAGGTSSAAPPTRPGPYGAYQDARPYGMPVATSYASLYARDSHYPQVSTHANTYTVFI